MSLGPAASRHEGGQDIVVDAAVLGPRLDRRARGVTDGLTQRHLVDPALAAVGAEDAPVRSGPLEELDLVVARQDPDLLAAELVRDVEQAHDVVPDVATLGAANEPDSPAPERQRRCDRDSVTRGFRLAGDEERRTAPARETDLVLRDLGQDREVRAEGRARGLAGSPGRRGGQHVVLLRRFTVAAALAEEHERHEHGHRRRGHDDRRQQRHGPRPGAAPAEGLQVRAEVAPAGTEAPGTAAVPGRRVVIGWVAASTGRPTGTDRGCATVTRRRRPEETRSAAAAVHLVAGATGAGATGRRAGPRAGRRAANAVVIAVAAGR